MIKLTGDTTAQFNRLAAIAFDILGLKGDATVDVEIIDDAEMRELNNRTRGVDSATDVLSFPALDRITDFTQKIIRAITTSRKERSYWAILPLTATRRRGKPRNTARASVKSTIFSCTGFCIFWDTTI